MRSFIKTGDLRISEFLACHLGAEGFSLYLCSN